MRDGTSLTEQALAEYRQRRDSPGRDAETTIGGETIDLDDPETYQSFDESFLGAANLDGVPRGKEALEAREIARTAPFQMILNAVTDQLLGGEVAFPSDDDDEDQAEAELKAIVGDVIDGPHHSGLDLDDLITTSISDMATLGDAFWELLAPTSGDLPAAAFKPVDAITIRYNVDNSGAFLEPAYYQAPVRGSTGLYTQLSKSEVTPLDQSDVLHLRWPGSARSHRLYPLPPALQLKEWLTIIADSTTHLGRYYKDNELPSGLLTAREATQTDIDSIRDELEAAKGDPRSAPVVGTDARWVEVGGSAVDLSHIEEQQWYLQLCMAAFGVPKTELGMDDQVNYSTSESELQVVAKRITSKVSRTIGQALSRQLLPQFELYTQLDQPFDVDLRYSDPREERIEEQRALDEYERGALPYRELRERLGEDMSDADTTVTINGVEIDYGAYPRHVVKALLREAREEPEPPEPVE